MDPVAAIRSRLEESRGQFENHEFDEKIQTGMEDSLISLSRSVDLHAASVYVCSRRCKTLQNLAAYNGGVNFIGRVRFENGYGLSAWVAKKQQTIYLPDIHRGSRHGHAPVRSYASLPMVQDEDILGVLNLAHIKPNAFERPEMTTIKSYIESLKPILQMYQRHHNGFREQKENPSHR